MTDPTPASSALGSAFGRLWAAAIASNLADGVARMAIPLTAVHLTSDPVAISLLTALAYVPWLVFGVPSGMIVDHVDRRVAMAAANAARMVAAVGVAIAIATGHASIAVLAAAVLLFGLGETLFDNATNAVMPALVGRRGLDKANGRIQAAQVGVDMFVATPISGVLFAIAMILPMVVGALGYVVAACLVLTLPVAAAHARAVGADGRREAGVPLRDALGFLWRHRYLRSMVAVTSIIGGFLAFAQAVTVLVFVDRFGVTAAAVGLVTAGIGLGGVAGALLAERIVQRFGRGRTMLAATLLGGLGLAAVAIAPNAGFAVAAYAVSAFGIACWNVPWGALRQAIIPAQLLGRVLGAARTIAWGLMPIATLLGGWTARADLLLPFAIGGLGAAVVSLAAAPLLLSADRHLPRDGGEDEQPGDEAAPMDDAAIGAGAVGPGAVGGGAELEVARATAGPRSS